MAPEDFDEQQALLTNAPQAEPSLTARVVKGVAWVFAGKMVGRGLQLVTLVVLARLLTPEDFGLFGIVMLALATLETFSQTGFSTALIQRRGDIKGYLDTAWTVQVIRGFVLAGVLYASAPVVGWFFNEPRVVSLLRLLCVTEVLRSFTNIGIIYFRKELQFHKQVAYNLLGSLASVAVGIALAFYLRSVWALVWARVAGAVARCLLSYLLHPYRPRPRFQTAQALELFRFGRWMLGSAVVGLLGTQGDRAVLGKLLGAASLGLYSMAHTLGELPATEISFVTSHVMMPAYAKVQHDRAKLSRGYAVLLESVAYLTLPLMVFVVIAAPDIVLTLLGSQWQLAIGPLRILAVAAGLRSIVGTGAPLFRGAGRPHFEFYMHLARVVTTLAAIIPFTLWLGVKGAAIASLAGAVALVPAYAFGLCVVRVNAWAIWWSLARAASLAVGVAAAALGTKISLAHAGVIPLAFMVLSAGAVSVAFTLIVGLRYGRGPYAVATRALAALRG